MSLSFASFTKLLQDLEDFEAQIPKPGKSPRDAHVEHTLKCWFSTHRRAIEELGINGQTALLSSLLPERRTDRKYGLQESRLCQLLLRALNVGRGRRWELEEYKTPGRGDLGECLYRYLSIGGCHASPPLGLEEIDSMLNGLASHNSFSDLSIQALAPPSSEAATKVLENILMRSSPIEGKWLVRLILKKFSTIQLDERPILGMFHFLLPDLLAFQNNFEAAVSLLAQREFREIPQNPDFRSRRLWYKEVSPLISPTIGVKIGRPTHRKARSMANCFGWTQSKRWVVERKYDGEYCQIHIDLQRHANPLNCINIFSKNGKDSTADRKGVHQTLIECLRLGDIDCKIQKRAILLGELVVFSDQDNRVADFDKIRKYVTRSGRKIGTAKDSPRKSSEHLAIVFFDVLLLDDEMLLNRPIHERRHWLKAIYKKIPGRAFSSEWKIIDFSQPLAKERLIEQYAAAINLNHEGLVLKPCDAPYFGLGSDHFFIKLKKDYIEGLGDEGDFALVGASYDAGHALAHGLPNLPWTDFHLACLLNAEDVKRYDARPRFKYVETIREKRCIPAAVLQSLTDTGKFMAKPFVATDAERPFDIVDLGAIKIKDYFKEPMVVEILGSGYVKPSDCDFFMLRHARMKKHHHDRSWKDTESFQDLQDKAKTSKEVPDLLDTAETKRLIARLMSKSRRKFERDGTGTPGSRRTSTPSRADTPSTVSPLVRNRPQRTSLLSQDITNENLDPNEGTSPSRSIALDDSPSLVPALDGTTLIGNMTPPASKRPLEDISCNASPSAKRAKHHVPSSPTSTPSRSRPSTARSDISPHHQTKNPRPLLPTPASTSSPQTRHQPPRSPPTSSPLHTACTSPSCPFTTSTLYIPPSLLRLTSHLHPTPHLPNLVPSLHFWDRDSFSHSTHGPTVSESQSHPGCRKVVLVETLEENSHNKSRDGDEHEGMEAVIEQIENLNQGMFREEVEVWDWRVLRCWGRRCGSGGGGGTEKKGVEDGRYWVGRLEFDEEVGRAGFVYA